MSQNEPMAGALSSPRGRGRSRPMPRSGLRLAVLGRLVELLAGDLASRVGQPVARLGVRVDRVKQPAPDVVLRLGVGAVADAHRLRVLVAVEVRQHLLDQLVRAGPSARGVPTREWVR